MLKKSLAILLVMLIAFTSAVTAFGTEGSLTEGETVSDSSNAGNGEAVTEETSDTIVARASLFAAMYVFPVSGHTWIYVENLTDEPMTVGIYEVPAGQGVSVGVFSFSVNDGWGIYYNLEAYRENRNDNVGDCRSITIDMTRSELEKLSDSIKNYPNMWEIFIFNCTFFAFSVWNDNSDNFFIPMMIPALAMLEVIIAGAPKGVTPMYYPTQDQVFKQRGTGDSAYLEPVGEKTLSK